MEIQLKACLAEKILERKKVDSLNSDVNKKLLKADDCHIKPGL